MRRLCLISLLLLCVAAPVLAAPINWVENPRVLIPGSSDRPLCLFFHSDEDRSARRMITWSFTDPGVASQMSEFAPIMIEMGSAPNIAAHFGIMESPTLLAITPTQRVLNQHTGFLDANGVIDFLLVAKGELIETEQMEETFDDPARETGEEQSDPGAHFLEETPQEPVDAESGFARSGRVIVPQHRPVEFAHENEAVAIQVTMPDHGARVTLHWRAPGSVLFNDVPLYPNTPEIYYGTIPALAVTLHGLEYYITVAIGNQSMTLPPDGPGRPYQIGVR